MPLPRPKSTFGQAVLPVVGGIAFFAVLALVLWGVAGLVSRGGDGVQSRLGDDVFRPGKVEPLAEEILESGPLLFPGLVGTAGTRAIGVYHVGTDAATGWRVFSLVPPGAPAACVLEVDRGSRQLVDRSCSGDRYPADGTGLDPLPWTVDDEGTLAIDLTPGGAPGQGPSTTSS